MTLQALIQFLIKYIDVLIFGGFLLLNLIVGLRYRGGKTSFQEYAIGDKKFSTATLTATIVATWMSGSALFIDLEETYSKGLYYIIATVVGSTAGLLITGRVIGPRMGKFLNNVSVPESLGKLYGKRVQAIAGIGGVLSTMGYIAIQFKVIANTLSILLGYDSPWITAIAATTIILYSASGGVKAVTFTDVIQFFTFGSLLPVLALVIWNNLEDTNQVMHVLNTNPLFSFKKVVRWSPEFMETLILICYFSSPDLPPQLFQRIAMARDVTQVKRSLTYAAAVCLAVEFCMMWIAILLLTDRPGLEPSQLVNYMVNTYTYPGLRGFLGIGVVALAMSTADSSLNSCAVLVANDIFPPKESNRESSLTTARLSTLILGTGAMILALFVQNLLSLLLLSANFYAPIFVIPMLLAIFGFQTSRRVVFMAMAAGFTTVIACLAYFQSVNSFFPGMLANLIVMLGAHYLLGEEGGWGNNPVKASSDAPESKTWQEWLTEAREFNLYNYLERTLPIQDYFYSLFGFYIFTATYASFYLLPNEIIGQCTGIYQGIQYSVALLTTTFLTFPIWPKVLQQRRFLTWIWPLSVFYTLFFVGGNIVIMSGFAVPQMLILALNFVMAVLLLQWQLAVGMAIVGVWSAVVFFKQCTGWASLPGDLGTLQFKIVYGLLLLSSFLIALFKHKEVYKFLERRNELLTTEREMTNEELVRVLHHEERFFSEVATAGSDLLEAVDKKVENFSQQTRQLIDTHQTAAVSDALREVKGALRDTMDYLRSVIYRTQSHIRLEVETISFSDLITEALEVLEVQEIVDRPRPIVKYLAKDQELQCDATRIQQLLVNALFYAQQHGHPQQSVLLGIQATTLGYPIPSVKNHIKEVDALCIMVTRAETLPISKVLYMGATGRASFHIPQSTEDLALLDNQRIVDAHYGATELIVSDEGLVQVYVIPLRLREVRPKMMDIPQMEIGGIGEASQEVLPEETALLTRFEKEAHIDMELATKAIQIIKKYHGHAKYKSGEPFYLHPIASTEILLDYTQDSTAILATLLHDTVKDTALTLAEIGTIFGADVAAIVNKVTHLEGQFQRIHMDEHENIHQVLEESDTQVLQVKLADRTHNMRTIQRHPRIAKQKKIAEETLHFFVPIAKHLGLKQLEEELQGMVNAVMSK